MIPLATKIATPLATSLAGVVTPPVPTIDPHLCVLYQFKGTASHLSFIRYPEADIDNGGTMFYAWKCCDTELISIIYTTKIDDLTTSDTLYRHEDSSFVIADGVIEQRDGSIWTFSYTVLVLDEIQEENADRIYVDVDGDRYANTVQSFCIAPAYYDSSITISIHDASTYSPYWSDGSTERVRTVYINPYSYGYQITRLYPVDYTFSGDFDGNVERVAGCIAEDANFPSSYWSQPVGTTMRVAISGHDSFGHAINEYRTLTLSTTIVSERTVYVYGDESQYPYVYIETNTPEQDGAPIYLSGALEPVRLSIAHSPEGAGTDVIECEGETYVGEATIYPYSEITVTANPATGYTFDKWTWEGAESPGNPAHFTMPEENFALTAHYNAI